jgi:FkbM family methyltransferase
MFTIYDRPLAALARYLSNSGRYPWTIILSTPIGSVRVTLADRHDLLTVNEVFCRQDYGPGAASGVTVDVGANVGLAALYFLTRGRAARVVCVEPDPANLIRLRVTLCGLEDSYHLIEAAAVSDGSDHVEFVPAGRYGHTARPEEVSVTLPAVSVRDVMAAAGDVALVNLVKVDTEGSEQELVAAIRADARYDSVPIVYEDAGGTRWV